MAKLLENKDKKIFSSTDYNYVFDKKTGYFARWGKTKEEDPQWSKYGPEIADIEISTTCKGVDGIGPCKFCYKANTPNGTYMTLETFKKVFYKFNRTLTQIAFGIGDIDSNPDMWDIFDFCILNGITPNLTINGEGITDEIANKLVQRCGAIAVSFYDENKTLDTIKKLTDLGLTQCNIHFMLSKETYDIAMSLLDKVKTDSRLEKLNAIVFLSLKSKGRAVKRYNSISEESFGILFQTALQKNVNIGFDSCSAQKAFKADINKQFSTFIEPCESTLFSSYVNVEGEFFPCSFIEGTEGWKNGISLLDAKSMDEVWHSSRTYAFRKDVLGCRDCSKACPVYTI
jgi:hypothetical protein